MKTRYVRRVAMVEVSDRCIVYRFKHPVVVQAEERVVVRIKSRRKEA